MTSIAPTTDEIAERQEIEARFATFTLTDEQRDVMEKIREATRAYVAQVIELAPSSRERSAALTSIEEGKYWANQAIARRGPSPVDWTEAGL